MGTSRSIFGRIGWALLVALFLLFLLRLLWVEQRWRFTDFDDAEQHRSAMSGGFVDKSTYLSATALGIHTLDDWTALSGKARSEGYSSVADLLAAGEGGFESAQEFESARAAGIGSRLAWLADADWERIERLPDAFFSIQAASGSCEILQSMWSAWKGRQFRHGSIMQRDPAASTFFLFLLNEEIDQREVVVVPVGPFWRSRKLPDHYMVYSPTLEFSLYRIAEDGVPVGVWPQLGGVVQDGVSALQRTLDVTNGTRLRASPDDFAKWGIAPDADMDDRLGVCDESTYETILDVPFVEKKTGRTVVLGQLLAGRGQTP